MTITTDLFALLSGNTSASVRVYPLTAPDQVVKPYITYQRISSSSENVLSGNSGLTNTRMQIDVYATTYIESMAIASQIDSLMNGFKQTISLNSQDLYEDIVKLFRVQTDYSIWH